MSLSRKSLACSQPFGHGDLFAMWSMTIACCLARFVRGLHRRAPSGVRQQCAQLTYVLDRWHRQNHTACVNPGHALYLPEVRIESHPVLRDYNSSNSEQFNAWLELFVSITRSMRPEKHMIALWCF